MTHPNRFIPIECQTVSSNRRDQPPDDEQIRVTADERSRLRTLDEHRATNGSVNCGVDHLSQAMEQSMNKQHAFVLGGGGSRGALQVGRYMRYWKMDFNPICLLALPSAL